jgi:hypothetical protein
MGSAANPDITIKAAKDWEDCCHICSQDEQCVGWTFFTAAAAAAAAANSGNTATSNSNYNNDNSSRLGLTPAGATTVAKGDKNCHLHANTKDQHSDIAHRITGLRLTV